MFSFFIFLFLVTTISLFLSLSVSVKSTLSFSLSFSFYHSLSFSRCTAFLHFSLWHALTLSCLRKANISAWDVTNSNPAKKLPWINTLFLSLSLSLNWSLIWRALGKGFWPILSTGFHPCWWSEAQSCSFFKLAHNSTSALSPNWL